MRHINIPIFIPHLGCPNQCVFCNQRTISGVQSFELSSVKRTIEDSLSTISPEDEVEIAFFGGSFTGIDRTLMCQLLEIAYEYVKTGAVSSIRCSTRPDYINTEILDILSKYGVKVIELGLQSTDEAVLLKTKRGHSFLDEARACELIVSYGFTLIGQMMIGLPGSTLESEIKTAEFIINSGASGARIYPTVVFHSTELCEMARCGEYTPLSLTDAVVRSATVMKRFVEAGVEVIRVGLCSSENLSQDTTYFAGPNHPALGELVENELYYEIIKKKLEDTELLGDTPVISVPRGSLSKAIGHKKKNRLRLCQALGLRDIRFVESKALSEYEVMISVVERR